MSVFTEKESELVFRNNSTVLEITNKRAFYAAKNLLGQLGISWVSPKTKTMPFKGWICFSEGRTAMYVPFNFFTKEWFCKDYEILKIELK